jgi:NHL repeat
LAAALEFSKFREKMEMAMKLSRVVYLGALAPALVVGLGLWNPLEHATARDRPAAPRFRVDPFWPRPLPVDAATGKPWVTGEVGGTCIDSHDHVITVNRAFQNGLVAPETVIAVASPPVVEYDRQGNVANAWGNPAILPTGIHGCFVDFQDNVWIAGNGDGIVQKYSHDGSTLLLQIGTKGMCDWPANGNKCGNSGGDPGANQSHTLLNEPANMTVDPSNGDVYVADGYGNHRVAVFDKNGKFLRQWGGVVTSNSDPEPGKFAAGDGGHPHCVVLGNDQLVYVCDRADDRIQVFDKMGNLNRIILVKPGTGVTPHPDGSPALGTAGSAWDLTFSNDDFQTFMFEVDGGNEVLHIFDRAPGTIIGGFGRPGHLAGEFTFLHSVTIDSKGNLFTGETIGGRRIQKFVQRGGQNEGE